MTKAFTSVSIPLLVALMLIPFSAAFAAGPVQLVTEYPLPGKPVPRGFRRGGARLGHLARAKRDRTPCGFCIWDARS